MAQEDAQVTEVSLLNFVVSDGSTLVATRYVSHENEEAASLYYAEGSTFHRLPPEQRALDAPSTPAMPSKGSASARADKGAAPSSPTANAASARNTAVAGEVSMLDACTECYSCSLCRGCSRCFSWLQVLHTKVEKLPIDCSAVTNG